MGVGHRDRVRHSGAAGLQACPIGVQRRFECVESAPGKDEGLILGMIAGESPAAEASPAAIRRLVEAGVFTPEQGQAALGA